MGVGRLMLAGLFLFVPVIIFELVVEGMAGVLRLVTVSVSGCLWPSKRDSGIGGLFSQGQLIPKSGTSHQYDRGYEEAAALAQHRSLSDIHTALHLFAPKAKSEYEWGTVDALADELISRGKQNTVL